MSFKYPFDYDVIIIGSGIAGMYTALNINSNKNVLLISKSKLSNNNTNLAQGGIAVTFNKEDYDSHIEDTYKTGNYYNNRKRLKIMVEEGADNINTLINWGVNFDVDKDNKILFTKEGGHSKCRIIHYKDTTGSEIMRGLIERIKIKNNIFLLEDTFVVDLILNNKELVGLKMINNKVTYNINCNSIVIATGGIGELYANTTNSQVATGDGIAFAYRAGVNIEDMEFVQFHPTALNVPGHSHFLISEAVRGEGGILRNEKSVAFMKEYHELSDLAPRSIVSRAILEECIKQNNNRIYLDITHLESDYIKNRFPNITRECLKRGIDITKEYIPITPVQHYIMGGIKTDEYGRTNIEGLYSCGETACTGVHGANRMASNSLLEAIVFAKRIAVDLNTKKIKKVSLTNKEEEDYSDVMTDDIIDSLKEKLQMIMSENVFVFRNKNGLNYALEEVEKILNNLPREFNKVKEYELLNMITVAKIIIKAAIERKNSLGSHMIDGGN